MKKKTFSSRMLSHLGSYGASSTLVCPAVFTVSLGSATILETPVHIND